MLGRGWTVLWRVERQFGRRRSCKSNARGRSILRNLTSSPPLQSWLSIICSVQEPFYTDEHFSEIDRRDLHSIVFAPCEGRKSKSNKSVSQTADVRTMGIRNLGTDELSPSRGEKRSWRHSNCGNVILFVVTSIPTTCGDRLISSPCLRCDVAPQIAF